MAMKYIPLTLDVGRYLDSMTKLIGDVRFTRTLVTSDIVSDIIDASRVGRVDFGYGIIYNFLVDVQEVENLTETSVVTRVRKPQIEQEVITIDTYKRTQVSVSEVLTRANLLDGSLVQRFTDWVVQILETTYNHHLYEQVIAMFMGWEGVGAKQTVEVFQYDIDALTLAGATPLEINEAKKFNGTVMAEAMRKTMNNMKILDTGYTDIATYTSSNDPFGEFPVKTALDSRGLTLHINDVYWTEYMANSLAALYHNKQLMGMIPQAREVLIPENSWSTPRKNVIAVLSQGDKFALADFYKLTFSFNDASNLFTNIFLHFAYGLGVFKYAPAVEFISVPIVVAP